MSTKLDSIIQRVRIQYPTMDPVSLQRTLTQIKELLEDTEYYRAQQQAYAADTDKAGPNIFVESSAPAASDGDDGDIWFQIP
jgi:hypothetical protein